CLRTPPPPSSTLFPYTTLFRSSDGVPHTSGTINMDAVDGNGDISSVTTTSGLSWKLPGRIGDSPIVGAGQYCDNEVGAAGSTGRDRKSTRLNSSHDQISYAVFC